MKRKIATDLLRRQLTLSQQRPNPFQTELHSMAYLLISDMIGDVKRPFRNICLHGRNPQLIIPQLYEHNAKFGLTPKDFSVTVVDWLRNEQSESQIRSDFPIKEMRYVQNPDMWLPEEDKYDLLVSALQSHHSNSEEELFRRYLRSLSPDGALVGCTFAEGTLTELYWSYLMAENERHGGMSPKVMSFPSLGEIGTSLTSTGYKLITILSHDWQLEFDSPVDLLVLLQEMGESGYLRGRRKGVFPDLLLAASALYSSQFSTPEGRVTASASLSKFIAWKFHQAQPKSLKPGPHVDSIQFADQLLKFGQVENYIVEEGMEDAKKIK